MVVAKWTGTYPNLCSGEWLLWINGEDVSYLIPCDKKYDNMSTYGTYSKWCFTDDWEEDWSTYESGFECEEWIHYNNPWLEKITQDEDLKEDIYYAFSSQDWRHGSCGGCI